MIVEFSSSLRKTLDEDIAALTQALVNGRAADYAAYRHMVGKLQGLVTAREHLQERENAYMEE